MPLIKEILPVQTRVLEMVAQLIVDEFDIEKDISGKDADDFQKDHYSMIEEISGILSEFRSKYKSYRK